MVDIAFFTGWILFTLIVGVIVQLWAEDAGEDTFSRFIFGAMSIVGGALWFIIVPLGLGVGLLMLIAHKINRWLDDAN